MKKILISVLALSLVVLISGISAFAVGYVNSEETAEDVPAVSEKTEPSEEEKKPEENGHTAENCKKLVDENGDGLCDNCVDEDGDGVCDRKGNKNGKNGKDNHTAENCKKLVDENGDGLCDNCVDEDGDGVCDNKGGKGNNGNRGGKIRKSNHTAEN